MWQNPPLAYEQRCPWGASQRRSELDLLKIQSCAVNLDPRCDPWSGVWNEYLVDNAWVRPGGQYPEWVANPPGQEAWYRKVVSKRTQCPEGSTPIAELPPLDPWRAPSGQSMATGEGIPHYSQPATTKAVMQEAPPDTLPVTFPSRPLIATS